MNNIMMKIRIISFLLLLLLVSSCYKELTDYNLQFEGNKLVFNGLLTEKGISATLTKSVNPAILNKPEDVLVEGGHVWLYRNDTLLIELSKLSKDKFESKNMIPQIGVSYEIKAVAAGFDTLYSKNIQLPAPPIIRSYTFVKNDTLAINTSYGASLFTAILGDDTITNIKNNYMIDSYVRTKTDSVITGYLKGTIYNGNTSSSCEFDSYVNIPFFTDKCFNGSDYKIYYFSEHQRKGTMVLEFSSINEDFLKYLRSLDQPLGLELNFAEPKIQYSNIKNGYGIFVAKNTKSFTLKLD